MAAYMGVGLTLTFGEQIENHIGMQKIGQLAEYGFSAQYLQQVALMLQSHNIDAQLINLGSYLPPEYGTSVATIIVIKSGLRSVVGIRHEDLMQEISNLKHDTKAKMKGKVVNKHARHNLCFSDFMQAPNYEAGQGTVYDFKYLPNLSKVRAVLPTIFGDKAKNLGCESNLYYDLTKCGIGYHGDKERKIVIGVRLGQNFPLVYQWFYKSSPVGNRIDLNLEAGDIYVMDDKASGFDWLKRNIPTLRHAAGCEDYIKTPVPKKKKESKSKKKRKREAVDNTMVQMMQNFELFKFQ
jgi:hypothetical protein